MCLAFLGAWLLLGLVSFALIAFGAQRTKNLQRQSTVGSPDPDGTEPQTGLASPFAVPAQAD